MLNIKLLDPYVVSLLKKGGWSENRYCDVKYWIDKLTIEGYVCFDYALDILENLGGLTFNVKDDCNHKGAQFDFNPYFAANGEFDRLEDFELLAKEGLFPIGSMCAAIGSMNRLYWAGTNIEDYLNKLFDKEFESQEIDV